MKLPNGLIFQISLPLAGSILVIPWKECVGGNYFSSPICINGKLYNVDRDGEVVVVAASDQYQLLGRSQLNETILSTFAVGDGRLYAHTESHLISLGGK